MSTTNTLTEVPIGVEETAEKGETEDSPAQGMLHVFVEPRVTYQVHRVFTV